MDEPKTLHREPDDRAGLHRIYTYLLRGMAITRPNQVRCAEIVYIPVQYGFLYLVVTMIWATCNVLDWRLSNTMDTGFCVEALNEALATDLVEGF